MLGARVRNLVLGVAAPLRQSRGLATLSGWRAASAASPLLASPLLAARASALPAMLLRQGAAPLAPALIGASRQMGRPSNTKQDRKPSNKMAFNRLKHARRSKRDWKARQGIKPPTIVPDHRWGIHVRDEVVVYLRKRFLGKGRVLRVSHKTSRVWVQGIKLREFPTADTLEDFNLPLTYETREHSVHYSDCNLIDPLDGKRTRLRFRYLHDGRRVRVATRSGAIIPRAKYEPQTPRSYEIDWSAELTTPRAAVLERTYIAPAWATSKQPAPAAAALQ